MRFDPATIASRDPQQMLALVTRFRRMCEEAWSLGAAGVRVKSPQAVVAVGMGGSGIGGDLLRAVVFDEATVPVASIKEYRAPAFAGPQTLVLACSYSGETEETLAAYDEAVRRDAACVVITSGGELLRRAQAHRHVAVVIPKGLPPRAALPYLFLPMLAVLGRVGGVRSFDAELREAVQVLQRVTAQHGPDPPDSPARRPAEALPGRIPVIYSAVPFLEPAAERRRDQFNDNAKTVAVWNTFPELNHNETVGWGLDEALARLLHVIILRDAVEPPRLALRAAVTRDLALSRAGGLDEVHAAGTGELGRLLSAVFVVGLVRWGLAPPRDIVHTAVVRVVQLQKR